MKRLMLFVPLLFMGLMFVGCMSDKSPNTGKNASALGTALGTDIKLIGDLEADMQGKTPLAPEEYAGLYTNVQGFVDSITPVWNRSVSGNDYNDFIQKVHLLGTEKWVLYRAIFTRPPQPYYGQPYCMAAYKDKTGERMALSCYGIISDSPASDLLKFSGTEVFRQKTLVFAYIGDNSIQGSTKVMTLPPLFPVPYKKK